MNKEQRRRLERMQELIQCDMVGTFAEIFTKWGYPVSYVAKAIHKNTDTMRWLVDYPEELKGREVMKIAAYFEVDYKMISILIERMIRPRQDAILQNYKLQQRGRLAYTKAGRSGQEVLNQDH